MKAIDFFAGIGGIKLWLLQASKEKAFPIEVLAFSDIKKESIKAYPKLWWEDLTNLWDITKIKPKELPDFDILLGGFPCQSYSMAGKRLGLNDHRGQLIYNIFEIVEQKRPKLIFLENVKGITTIDWGNTIADIMQKFTSLGYNIEYYIINSKDFWVPQSRQRVYFVGFHSSLCSSDEAYDLHLNLRKAVEAHKPIIVKLSSIIENLSKEEFKSVKLNDRQAKMTLLKDSFCWSIKGVDDISNAITKTYWKVTGQSSKIAFNALTNTYLTSKEISELYKSYEEEARMLKVFKDSLKAQKLPLKEKNVLLDKFFDDVQLKEHISLRILTPTEALKLQGYPKDFIEQFNQVNLQPKEAYSLIWDSVSVPVIKYLWDKIISNL